MAGRTRAMVFAAGFGERMRPLTDRCPKPLLKVGGKALIRWQLEKLPALGIREVVINTAWLGEQIEEELGDGSTLGLDIVWSREGEPLDTGAGLLKALPLLGDEPFLLLNADVWSDCPLAPLLAKGLGDSLHGRLLLVPNPAFHRQGDFLLAADGQLGLASADNGEEALTYSGMALLAPALLKAFPNPRPRFPLVEVFRHAIAEGRLAGECWRGQWWDVGTPERLSELDAQLESVN